MRAFTIELTLQNSCAIFWLGPHCELRQFVAYTLMLLFYYQTPHCLWYSKLVIVLNGFPTTMEYLITVYVYIYQIEWSHSIRMLSIQMDTFKSYQLVIHHQFLRTSDWPSFQRKFSIMYVTRLLDTLEHTKWNGEKLNVCKIIRKITEKWAVE